MGLFHRWSINAIFFTIGLVYFLGLLLEIMDVDSAQYAAISREMLESGEFLQVHLQGKDYLDKPPFLFWITSFFFWLFGLADWSFKMGSALFSILGVISTYKLGNLLYNKRIGFVAALMLMTATAFIWMNQDVRTDTILTSAVVFSVWKLTAYLYYKRKRDLVWGFVGIAIAMMTKGPIGLMVPVLALTSYTIGRKRYKDLFRWEWLLGIGIVMILLTPMSWGLYEQFDAQPEKVYPFPSEQGVMPRDSVSGLRFYFWEQSFGRLTGENVWNNNTGPDFFVHTFLWSFFPWSLLAVWALFWRIAVAVMDVIRGEKKQEWLTLGAFILPFLALSMSQFKLPHYINVILPFAAIFTSEFTLRIAFEKGRNWYRAAWIIQLINILAALAIYIAFVTVFFPDAFWGWYLIGAVGFGVSTFFLVKGQHLDKLVLSTVFAAMTTHLLLNGLFFPELMKYQPSDEVARDLRHLNVSEERFFVHRPPALFSLSFYAEMNLNHLNDQALDTLNFYPESYFYSGEDGLQLLSDHHISYEVVREYPNFKVTALTFEFLNAATRKDAVEPTYLVRILTQ